MNLFILFLLFIVSVIFIGSFLKKVIPVAAISIILILVIGSYFNVPIEKQLEIGEKLAIAAYDKIKEINFKAGIQELKEMWKEIRKFNVSLKESNSYL